VAAAAVGLAALAVGNQVLAKRAERRHPPKGAFLEVDGVRRHYLEAGSGEPVVLIHGNGVTAEDWVVRVVATAACAAAWAAWTAAPLCLLGRRRCLTRGLRRGFCWITFCALARSDSEEHKRGRSPSSASGAVQVRGP
jgi:hypothetical protein